MMVQTTLFNYLLCNNKSFKQTTPKIKQLKQTIIKVYFSLKPKKKSILEYFDLQKEKVKEKEKKPVFDLALVDIEKTVKTYSGENNMEIKCIKKNIYDQDLKYIAISYRWGKVNEQLVETPNYTAHITSFDLRDLRQLCGYILFETDLKEIPYLWIDAISVNQQNHEGKKKTILKMSTIYKKATYILAVPDLHKEYLWKNTANREMITLLEKYNKTIHNDILNNNNNNNNNNQLINKMEGEGNKYFMNDVHQLVNNDKSIQTENEDIKKAYQYLVYLILDWSSRAWVVSEYKIAKEKQKNQGTPLKYIFLSLLFPTIYHFFSYSFENHHDHDHDHYLYNNIDVYFWQVGDSITFINYLKTTLIQKTYLEMILDTNASRNEDRFNAILPPWTKYNHLIKGKSTVTSWKITNMTPVRLKLYELMDDVWDKARLLLACSFTNNTPILPSFASQYISRYLYIIEKENPARAYEMYLSDLKKIGLQHISWDDKNENENRPSSLPLLYTENLLDIQLSPH
ncbi:unnamed protein product [Cunninghamella echinulata]